MRTLPVFAVCAALALAACERRSSAPAPAEPVPAPPAAPAVLPASDPKDVALDQIRAAMVGTWRNVEDPKAGLVIRADGTWSTTYDDGTGAPGTWRIFRGAEAPTDGPYRFAPDSTYVEVKDQDGVFHHEMATIGGDRLDIYFVGRGNREFYERAK